MPEPGDFPSRARKEATPGRENSIERIAKFLPLCLSFSRHSNSYPSLGFHRKLVSSEPPSVSRFRKLLGFVGFKTDGDINSYICVAKTRMQIYGRINEFARLKELDYRLGGQFWEIRDAKFI